MERRKMPIFCDSFFFMTQIAHVKSNFSSNSILFHLCENFFFRLHSFHNTFRESSPYPQTPFLFAMLNFFFSQKKMLQIYGVELLYISRSLGCKKKKNLCNARHSMKKISNFFFSFRYQVQYHILSFLNIVCLRITCDFILRLTVLET